MMAALQPGTGPIRALPRPDAVPGSRISPAAALGTSDVESAGTR